MERRRTAWSRCRSMDEDLKRNCLLCDLMLFMLSVLACFFFDCLYTYLIPITFRDCDAHFRYSPRIPIYIHLFFWYETAPKRPNKKRIPVFRQYRMCKVKTALALCQISRCIVEFERAYGFKLWSAGWMGETR